MLKSEYKQLYEEYLEENKKLKEDNNTLRYGIDQAITLINVGEPSNARTALAIALTKIGK